MEHRLLECLRIALKYNASDIHLSLYQNGAVIIEMRVNGVIRKLRQQQQDQSFFNYLLYRANLDLSKTHQPQTGSFEAVVDGKRLALRFSIVSCYAITSGVLRILNNHAKLRVDDLTYCRETLAWLKNIPNHQSGLVLFSGPTGSGKTTTLYTLLNEIEGKKIFTLEDPIEIYSSSYIQLAVNERGPLTYAEGIKQLMRHDPDIIMIGEIRDSVAAEMAVRCALTGHLVLSSVHSQNCVSTIQRMMELGIAKHQLETVLVGIANQRLFSLKNQKKTSIYEFMDQKELMHYFRTETTSNNFKTLSERVQEAYQAKVLSLAQIQANQTF